MKHNIIFLFLLPIVGTTSAFAQGYRGGTFETSFSATYGSVSVIADATSPLFQVSVIGRPVRYFSSFIRAGYFVTRAIEGEMELNWFTTSNSSPVGVYSLNVSWNIAISGSRFVPFLLAGGGYATGVPLIVASTTRDDFPVCVVVNLGAGLKYLLTEDLALRTEYRRQQLTTIETAILYSFPAASTMTVNYENVLFGFSMMF